MIARYTADARYSFASDQHRPPLGRRRILRSETEEPEARDVDDRGRHRQSAGDDHGRDRVREDVRVEDPPALDADDSRSEHVLVLLLRDHRAAQQPREDRDVHDADRDHHLPQTRAEHRDDRDREEQAGDGQHDVHHAHHDRAGPASDVAREGPEERADREPDRDRDDADQQRVARAVDDPAEDVAPLEVEAEPMFHARRLRLEDPVHEIDVVRRMARRDQRGEQGADHEDADDRRTDEGTPVVRQAIPGLVPEAARRLLELELGDLEFGD